MIWEVQARLFFDIENEADDFVHDCELAMAKSVIVNPGQPNEERGIIHLIDNHHDTQPVEPCAVLWEKKKS